LATQFVASRIRREGASFGHPVAIAARAIFA
jgi:hypothetical protein